MQERCFENVQIKFLMFIMYEMTLKMKTHIFKFLFLNFNKYQKKTEYFVIDVISECFVDRKTLLKLKEKKKLFQFFEYPMRLRLRKLLV